MASDRRSGHDESTARLSEKQGPGAASSSAPTPPPPVPPRPAGFGYQPLLAGHHPSASVVPEGSTAYGVPSTASNGPEEISQGLQKMSISSPRNGDPSRLRSANEAGSDGPLFVFPDYPVAKNPTREDLSRSRPRPATECIGVHVTFPTVWYTHPATPDFNICSWCYRENIRKTHFRDDFEATFVEDGPSRACLFGKPRMKDRLFPAVVSSGSLSQVLDFMGFRPRVPECAGTDGVKGSTRAVKWYRPKHNVIPTMVVCQACYEDHVLTHHHFAANFEPSLDQPPDDVWSCDLAVAFILDEYGRCADLNDWPRFIREASIRLSLQPCPKDKTVYPAGRQWFEPSIKGYTGFLICSSCYMDHVHHTSEESKWRDAGEDLYLVYGPSMKCCLAPFNVSMLAHRTLRETHDFELFWAGLDVLVREPQCDPKGTTNATWYTLTSEPDNFSVCRACYAAVVQPSGVSDYFKPHPSIPAGTDTTVLCSLSLGMPRIGIYLMNFLELMVTHNPTPLAQFASEYGAMPHCPRDRNLKNAIWYGWDACTICPECYYVFIRDTALEDSMSLQSIRLESWRMCEMYSPRMRGLYSAACKATPPDPTELFAIAAQRRAVYNETMPLVRQIISNQKLKLGRQQYLNNMSSFNNFIGGNLAASMPAQTFGLSSTDHRFQNQFQADGFKYGQQASAVGAQVGAGDWSTAEQLEARWREVE